jgi:hypothetical protein
VQSLDVIARIPYFPYRKPPVWKSPEFRFGSVRIFRPFAAIPAIASDPAFISLRKPAQPSRDLLGKQTANNSH